MDGLMQRVSTAVARRGVGVGCYIEGGVVLLIIKRWPAAGGAWIEIPGPHSLLTVTVVALRGEGVD